MKNRTDRYLVLQETTVECVEVEQFDNLQDAKNYAKLQVKGCETWSETGDNTCRNNHAAYIVTDTEKTTEDAPEGKEIYRTRTIYI